MSITAGFIIVIIGGLLAYELGYRAGFHPKFEAALWPLAQAASWGTLGVAIWLSARIGVWQWYWPQIGFFIWGTTVAVFVLIMRLAPMASDRGRKARQSHKLPVAC